MVRQRLITEFQVQNCRLEDLQRYCKWLGIPEETDGVRKSLVNWLIYEGHVEPLYPIGRMY